MEKHSNNNSFYNDRFFFALNDILVKGPEVYRRLVNILKSVISGSNGRNALFLIGSIADTEFVGYTNEAEGMHEANEMEYLGDDGYTHIAWTRYIVLSMNSCKTLLKATEDALDAYDKNSAIQMARELLGC